MLFFISVLRYIIVTVPHSNTSHVILYHNTAGTATLISRFKYISCYSLSLQQNVLFHPRVHSNTSHVILYRWHIKLLSTSNSYSNTSHVILYRLDRLRMPIAPKPFKYISCYSLSLTSHSQEVDKWHSNTSHVILYPTHFRLFLHYYTSSLLIFQYFIILEFPQNYPLR